MNSPKSNSPKSDSVSPALRALLDRRADEMLAACAPFIARAERAWDAMERGDNNPASSETRQPDDEIDE